MYFIQGSDCSDSAEVWWTVPLQGKTESAHWNSSSFSSYSKTEPFWAQRLMWGSKLTPWWIATRPALPSLCGRIHQRKDANSYFAVYNATVSHILTLHLVSMVLKCAFFMSFFLPRWLCIKRNVFKRRKGSSLQFKALSERRRPLLYLHTNTVWQKDDWQFTDRIPCLMSYQATRNRLTEKCAMQGGAVV